MKQFIFLGFFICMSSPAFADFTVCNETEQESFVSIGYKKSGEWMSEGWWTVPTDACEVIVSGALENRYYYLHAVNEGGKWTGNFSFCYEEEAYLIQGDKNCTTRGYKTGGFFEVDTNNATDWTQKLTR